ncbi:MAG: hypothetical protein ACRENH_07020 [Gemmatimonadaceae bacterium]
MCRSITGPGVRETLDLVGARIARRLPVVAESAARVTALSDFEVNRERFVPNSQIGVFGQEGWKVVEPVAGAEHSR